MHVDLVLFYLIYNVYVVPKQSNSMLNLVQHNDYENNISIKSTEKDEWIQRFCLFHLTYFKSENDIKEPYWQVS